MHICDYVYKNLTYLLMPVHAYIHMYIYCLLQLTYTHGPVVYMYLYTYIHMYVYRYIYMYIHTYEHCSQGGKAVKKSIWLDLSGKVMKMRENIKIFLIKKTLLKTNEVNIKMCFRILYHSLYADDHCMKLFLCVPLK